MLRVSTHLTFHNTITTSSPFPLLNLHNPRPLHRILLGNQIIVLADIARLLPHAHKLLVPVALDAPDALLQPLVPLPVLLDPLLDLPLVQPAGDDAVDGLVGRGERGAGGVAVILRTVAAAAAGGLGLVRPGLLLAVGFQGGEGRVGRVRVSFFQGVFERGDCRSGEDGFGLQASEHLAWYVSSVVGWRLSSVLVCR